MAHTPKLRRHVRGYGVVRLSGDDKYCGPWPDPGSPAPPEVEAAYHEYVARWVANGRKKLPARADRRAALVVKDLAELFVAEVRKDCTSPGNGPAHYELAFRPLVKLYGLHPAAEFDAAALEAVRDEMIRLGWKRSHVNRNVGRVRRCFRWGGRRKHVPPAVYQDLMTVESLRKGQRGVKERVRRRPAEESHVAAVAGHLTAPMAAMLWLCWHTGARPGEIRRMRVEEVDRSGDVWVYSLAEHKNGWRGQSRDVSIGPKGQAVLRPWLDLAGEGHVFSPKRCIAIHRAALAAEEAGDVLTAVQAEALHWFDRVPGRAVAAATDSYTANGFEASMRRAAAAAGLTWFSAYSCRHGARMRVSREAGDEAARAVLGQRSIETLVHYGQLDLKLATETQRKLG